MSDQKPEKSREEIKAEREAKKLAKQAAKKKGSQTAVPEVVATPIKPQEQKQQMKKPEKQQKTPPPQGTVKTNKSGEKVTPSPAVAKNVISEDKPQPKKKEPPIVLEKLTEKENIPEKNDSNTDNKPTKTLTKAERRALQEAQRAKKAQMISEKSKPTTTEAGGGSVQKSAPKKQIHPQSTEKTTIVDEKKTLIKKTVVKSTTPKVKLFSHLYEEGLTLESINGVKDIHPAVIRLGIQYATKTVAGSNARCRAFLMAIREVILDYKTPPQQEFSRGLEAQIQPCMNFLKKCRPLSVSMINAMKAIKRQLNHLNSTSNDDELKLILLDTIDTYIKDQIEKAARAISDSVEKKISNGDVILTYACSSLIQLILLDAHSRKVDFRVIIVDARPLNEGQEMLRRLVSHGIKCVCVLINAIGFIMPEVTKVMLGAHALLANGCVTSRTGTAQIAMVAKSFNVPVLVCCETHKFSDRVQTDAFVYNEIGDPNDLVLKTNDGSDEKLKNTIADWANTPYLTPLNLYYDVTPPELVTAVVTEVAILPCTSVPVILRIKPSELFY